ncbi:MAG: glutathione S-transferase N-terminal domain-containing protein [Rhodovarius sp.]|nr:glutathione S-transferase N-terminal domain-containing protein [Rhodovarius sp.]MDW8314098.1 glutathione S-transferase N-terminal domain-containing protein [Rhodovarius sp.]
MDIEEARRLVASCPHWHHAFEIYPGLRTPGSYDPEFMWQKMAGRDWRGLRVLEIGPADGFFSLRLAQAGAMVTCLDYRRKEATGFAVMERLTGLSFDYRLGNLLTLDPRSLGSFDVVLCLGVLYHLPDPLRGLHVCRQLCRGSLYLESAYSPDLLPEASIARFLPLREIGEGDYTNFWFPNRQCLIDMLTDAGFSVLREESWGDRIFLEAEIAGEDPLRRRRMETAYDQDFLAAWARTAAPAPAAAPAPPLTLYGRANSVNVMKLLWCLEELGLPYERRDAGMQFGVVDTPAYRALNPHGRIPTLVDGEVVVWESNACLRYLCLKAGGDAGGLYPLAPGRRARVDGWLDWQLSTLSPAERHLFWGMVRTPPEKRDMAEITAAMQASAACWEILDRHLAAGGPFIEGDFTIADIALGCFARRWFGAEVQIPGMPHFPALAAWYARLQERPGFARWVAPPLS